MDLQVLHDESHTLKILDGSLPASQSSSQSQSPMKKSDAIPCTDVEVSQEAIDIEISAPESSPQQINGELSMWQKSMWIIYPLCSHICPPYSKQSRQLAYLCIHVQGFCIV